MGYYVSSGQVSSGIALQNDFMYVCDGGTANLIAVNSGGKMYVSSGGFANDLTINSVGRVSVFMGGKTDSSFLNSRGELTVLSGGVAENTRMDAYSYLYISSGGVASNTTLGWRCSMFVSAGASAIDTFIDTYARMNIWVASDTYMTGTVAGSSFELSSGVLSGFTLYQNGNLYIISGCSALAVSTS